MEQAQPAKSRSDRRSGLEEGVGDVQCHDAHAAVEHTFVQFYPMLKPVAKKFGTYNEVREQVTDVK